MVSANSDCNSQSRSQAYFSNGDKVRHNCTVTRGFKQTPQV